MPGVADENLGRRAYWFIRIRWIAAPTVILVTFVVSRVLNIPVEARALYAIAVLLAAYNLAFLIHLRRLGSGHGPLPTETVYRTAALQISLDLLSLGALIHFSGGVENPFLFYFIFHMIIASILLSRRAAYLQACLAVSVFTAVAVLEYAGVLPHYCLDGFVSGTQHDNPLFVAGTSFVLASTVFAAVYMASSVASALREREAALAETNKLLVEHDCIKSEYVHRVTHDIKGHLSAIRSCLDPVADGVVGSLTAEQRNLTERARRRTDTLLTFVKALLELTRMRLCKTIAMDEFSVVGAVETAVSYVETKAAARSITVERDVGDAAGTIRGARIYIEETLGNILANAVKYSPAGGKVWIRVAGETDVVLVEIGDRGIGIPAEELPRVFDEFYRAANARAIERDGTGLGLSMAKQVVSRHGGEIWVESTEGVGTTVKLTLPRDPPAGRESPLA